MTSNRTLWDIESFEQGTILEEVLLRLQKDLQDMQKEIQKEQQETHVQLRELRKEEQHTKEELAQLKAGNKAYPKDLEQAKIILQNRLYQETGKSVQVEILADLMEIADESWRNAIEGYLGNNKLTLMVEPAYAKTALRIYEEMDKQAYFRVSVADTEKIMEDIHRMEEHSLAEEVSAKRDYAQAYLEFLLGKVVKCQNTEELRQCRIGITRECVLYQNYRIQHINPENYTRFAYIGKNSLRARIKLLEHQLAQLSEEREPKQQILAQYEAMLRLECLPQDVSVYLEWRQDMDELKQKEEQQKILREKLATMKAQNIGVWEEERKSVQELCDAQKEVLRKAERTMFRNEQELEKQQKEILALEGELTEKQGSRKTVPELEEGLQELLRGSRYPRYDGLRAEYQGKYDHTLGIKEKEKQNLVDKRVEYLRNYPNRNYSPTSEDNREYEELLEYLNCDRLEEYRKAAAEQARSAMEHFKDDFMFKIRSAIREALQRKDELNRIISRLDFGKDKYQFYIGKNKGADGRYYDMFMDDALEINPSQLEPSVDQQMNLFTMEHENHYGELMNDLINMFIPPEHASTEELEEAKRNMEKYADYRTYLSFDMQQLVQNEDETIHIRLSKMLRKNSGGEGQNPLYVALLASFAQAYRINLPPKLQRHPTIRLVVLDEAFSKMDAEKVASCI
ncbi:MAG: SbcC/MukB-like Walker B domain-containing protein, partial [Hungatella sp.]